MVLVVGILLGIWLAQDVKRILNLPSSIDQLTATARGLSRLLSNHSISSLQLVDE